MYQSSPDWLSFLRLPIVLFLQSRVVSVKCQTCQSFHQLDEAKSKSVLPLPHVLLASRGRLSQEAQLIHLIQLGSL